MMTWIRSRSWRKQVQVWVAGLAWLVAAGVQAGTFYVDVDWPGPFNGTADAPFKTLKAAVDAANGSGGSSIYIAAGWYGDVANGGAEDFSAGGGSDHGIVVTQPTAIYGGYAGWQGGTTFDWSTRTSRGTVVDLKDAASRAFRHQSGGHFYVDGLTFQNANIEGSGGAILSVYTYSGYATLTNCLFTNNVCTGEGGGAWLDGTFFPSFVYRCDFIDNRATISGGAYVPNAQNPDCRVEDCLFLRNQAGSGGAVYFRGDWGNNQYIRRCRFEGNSASSSGGAVLTYDPVLNLEHCVFTGNSAPYGAAVGGNQYGLGSTYMKNCLVVGNTGGYAVQIEGYRFRAPYTLDMLHCTVADNPNGGVRTRDGGGSFPGRIRNSIIANNGAYGIYQTEEDYVLSHNDVYGNADGDYYSCSGDVDSISVDPLFADAPGGDYHLQKASPCIDAGPAAGMSNDLDAIARPMRNGYDLGCYEEWQVPVIANRAPMANATSAVLRAEFTYESTGIVTEAWFVLDTQDRGTASMGDWASAVTAGAQVQGVIFGAGFVGLSPETTYFYRCVSSNGYDVFFGPLASLTTPPVGGTVRTWTGAGGDGLASNPTNWLGNAGPVSGDIILLDGGSAPMTWDAAAPVSVSRWTQTESYSGAVTFAMTYPSYSTEFTNFIITGDADVAGGTWKHQAHPSGDTARYRLAVEVGGNFTLGASAKVDVSSLGFQEWCGPGKGGGDNAGPSYGGQGGYGAGSVPVATYGSIFQPVHLGSGGGTGGGGGPGGGAFLLGVGGVARIDGSILAVGGKRPDTVIRPATGGSIFITASEVTGAGVLDVQALDINSWCGGGGGRISVIQTSGLDYPALVFRARGGLGEAYSAMRHGAAGTVYLQLGSQSLGEGRLIVDNGTVTLANFAATQPAEALDVSALEGLVVTNGGVFAAGNETAIDFAAARIVGGGELRIRGTNGIAFPAAFAVTPAYRLALDVPVSATGDWTLAPGAVLTHSPNYSNAVNPEYRVDLTVNGSLTVEAGGAIDVRGRGYYNFQGPGAGNGDNQGASHGGQGGYESATPASTYGNLLEPVSFGSGGRTGGPCGQGGGAVKLAVSGAMVINGSILAQGAEPSSSGGSIFLSSGTLSGSGLVDASGSFGLWWSAGGGGRIALHLTEGNSIGSITFRAFGGDSYNGNRKGAAGTIYVKIASDAPGAGTAFVINNALAPPGGTALPGTTEAGDVAKTGWYAMNGGRIRLFQNATVDRMTIASDGWLDLNGYTVTVTTLTIAGQKVFGGTYTAADLGSSVTDSSGGLGRIIVKSAGTVIAVY